MSVALDEMKDLADRTAIGLELGDFVMTGPQENIMHLHSRLAWATVAAQLHHEGYQMVTPEEFAATYSTTVDAVLERVEKQGTLFALFYDSPDETMILVPLDERQDPAAPPPSRPASPEDIERG